MEQLPTVQPQSPTLQLADVPLWARVLLGRVQQGIPLEDARRMTGSQRSVQTVYDMGQLHPDWYRYLMDAQQGLLDGQPLIPASEMTRAHAWAEEQKRHELAMEGGPKYAHPYMRLGAEIRKDVGQGAQASARVDVRLSISGTGGEPRLTTMEATATTEQAPAAPAPDDETRT